MRNDPQIILQMLNAVRSLDVGGWHKPVNAATHVLDINPYETRLTLQAIDPENSPRFTKETWGQIDICDRKPWPFPDKYFDFATCSHVLEDIRDPVWVVSELSRVAKAGYIECPSPEWELLVFVRLVTYLARLVPSNCVGASHHRWVAEMRPAEGTVLFRFKLHDLVQRKRYVPYTRLHHVRYESSVSWMFWKEHLDAKEEIFDLGEYFDAILPCARQLVNFNPLEKIKDKIRRIGKPNVYKQPAHGDGVRYPYL